MVANNLHEYLTAQGYQTTLYDIFETSAEQLDSYDLVFWGSSLYGDGKPNPIIELFFEKSLGNQHDYKQKPSAVFVLGDSFYPDFQGCEQGAVDKLKELNVKIVGTPMLLDGMPDEAMFEIVQSWAQKIIDDLS